MQILNVDVLVIGAGPSGCIAASIVHKAGYNVHMVEKEKFPRFVIGESLLPRCMEALEEAELLDVVKQQGFQEKFGAKFLRNNDVCDFNFNEQFTDGYKWTWQVPRGDFDKALAEEVARKGVNVHFETTVTDIVFEGSQSTTTIINNKGETSQIKAKFIIDSSGYGRVIPRLFNLDKPSNLPPRKSLFAHINDPKRHVHNEPNRIMVIVHQPKTWIWVIPFSTGVTSLGFVGSPEFFAEHKDKTPEEQLRFLINSEPHLKERFGEEKFVFEPKTLEGWSVTTEQFFGDGFVLTGNVTEFLDPMFSSGVTLAAASSQRAANLTIKQLQGEKIDWQKEFVEPTMKGVDVFRTYVMSWYDGTLHDIFFAKDVNTEFKKQICSVLAGYVWDTSNPFVKKHDRAVKSLSEVIRLNNGSAINSTI